MYGDNDYGGDASWMTDTPSTPVAAASPPPTKLKEAQPTNQPSWMTEDPGASSGVFGKGGFDEEDDEMPEPTPPSSWGDVANTRYQGSDNPDWMTTGASRNNNRNNPPDNINISHEFGDGHYRGEPDIQFEGDDSSRTTALLDSSNNKANKKPRRDRRGDGGRQDFNDTPLCGECCQSNWSLCTVVVLLLCGTASLGLFVLSLLQEFNMHPNVVGSSTGHNNKTLRVAAGAAGVAGAAGAPACPEHTCIAPFSKEYDHCAYQYQYVASNGQKVCGAPTCRLSNGNAPPGWSFPLAFTCPRFPSDGALFSCGWPYVAMLWRVLSSCGGAVAVVIYLFIIKRCQTCVGLSLWLINVLAFGHAVVSFICMVQDSMAVGQAQAFCDAGLKVALGKGGKKESVCPGGEQPSCVMFEYTLVCFWDAGLGLLWLAGAGAMCKGREKRSNRRREGGR